MPGAYSANRGISHWPYLCPRAGAWGLCRIVPALALGARRTCANPGSARVLIGLANEGELFLPVELVLGARPAGAAEAAAKIGIGGEQ